MKALVFDMDGTLANFYGVEGWLDDLHNERTRPYDEAEPLYEMDTLNALINRARIAGYRIIITSWLSKNSTKAYDEMVRHSKKEWLARYNFYYDEIHLVKYGTTKANCTRHLGGNQILIDDNAEVRKGWTLGATIDANENILEKIENLLDN